MDYNKLNRLIDHAMNYETDDYLLNINLKADVSDKLFSYQYRHVFNMMSSFRNNKVVLDGSDTGTGKTYTTVALCKQLRLKPLIICPKSIISNWEMVCKYFNVKPLAIVNYETIKNGKQYDRNGDRIESPYINIDDRFEDENRFIWKLPRYSVVIFDEVHKCKNHKSMNAKLLISTKKLYKVLMISATVSDKPETFGVFGYMLGFYNNLRKARGWIKSMLREDKCYLGSAPKLSSINRAIYPNKGSRIRIAELGKNFPDNQVSAICYKLDSSAEKEVNSAFDDIKIGEIKKKSGMLDDEQEGILIGEITKARKKIETYKIPIFEELINDYMENGFSVVVFVNYRSTLAKLTKIFKTKCIVYGGQSITERDKCIDDFQTNKEKLIICTMGAGSQSINLHDKYGIPRVSLISPTFTAIDLVQALGRIHRAGSKSPALQRIIYCANTCEEVVCKHINEKLKFQSKLNDNDLIVIN